MFKYKPDGKLKNLNKNTFDFTIAVVPKGASIHQDMLFIKSALLYADSITLISPMASTYFELTNDSNIKNEKNLLNLLEKVIPLCQKVDPTKIEGMLPVILQLKDIIYSKQYASIPMNVKISLISALKKFGIEISQALSNLLGEEDCKELENLIKISKVILHKFSGAILDDDFANEFFKILIDSVNNLNTFPLFDEQSNNLIKAAVNENVVILNNASRFNVKHAKISSDLLISLPSFEFATIDEILDIRKELEKPLVRFRRKMLSYNDEIQAMPWDEDFRNECFNLYHKDIAPAVLEIDELTRETSFIKNLSYNFLSDSLALKNIGGLVISIAAAGVISSFGKIAPNEAMIAGGGAFVISEITKAYKKSRDTQGQIAKKDMYFYYKASNMLTNIK